MRIRHVDQDLAPQPREDVGPGAGYDAVHETGHETGYESGYQAGYDAGQDPLTDLFEHSPAREVRTSAPAVVGFLAGIVALLAAPFHLTLGLALGLGALAVPASVLGLARASRPHLAGGLLASVGLVLALAALTLTGLRYLGVDTAVGAEALPALTSALEWLNSLVPSP